MLAISWRLEELSDLLCSCSHRLLKTHMLLSAQLVCIAWQPESCQTICLSTLWDERQALYHLLEFNRHGHSYCSLTIRCNKTLLSSATAAFSRLKCKLNRRNTIDPREADHSTLRHLASCTTAALLAFHAACFCGTFTNIALTLAVKITFPCPCSSKILAAA